MAPSLSSLLVFGSLLVSAFCAPAAKKAPKWQAPHHPKNVANPGPPHQVLTTQQLQTQQPTLNGLASNTNATLKYTTLGIGYQNYTCNGTAYVQTLPGSGAVAQLYDTTAFLRAHPSEIKTLSQDCNFNGCKYPKILRDLIGNHYFSDSNVPIFNLSLANPPVVLAGAKVGDVPAPSSTDIDWLLLVDKKNGVTQGLSEVYRLDTYQGKLSSTTCSVEGQTQSIAYTAQYWFYV